MEKGTLISIVPPSGPTASRKGACKAVGADFFLLREDTYGKIQDCLGAGSSESASCPCGRGGALNKSVRSCSGTWWILFALVHLCPILHAEQHHLSLPLSSLLFSRSSVSTTMGSCGGTIPQSLCHSGSFQRVKKPYLLMRLHPTFLLSLKTTSIAKDFYKQLTHWVAT